MSIGNQFSCLVLDLLKTHKLSLFQTYHQNYTEITPFSPYIFVVVTFSKKTKNALVLRCLFYATHRRHAREEDVE